MHLTATGLLLGEHDLVAETFEHRDRRAPRVREQRAVQAGDEEGYAHQRENAGSTCTKASSGTLWLGQRSSAAAIISCPTTLMCPDLPRRPRPSAARRGRRLRPARSPARGRSTSSARACASCKLTTLRTIASTFASMLCD